MSGWTIVPLQQDDLDEFVQCQFVSPWIKAVHITDACLRFESFVGNTLHDVNHPTQAAAVQAHRKAIEDGAKLQPGSGILYLKAVDHDSGKIVGGIKCCYYTGDDVTLTSPYAAGMPKDDPNASRDEQYRSYILNEFLGKRVRDIKGPHART